MHGKSLIDALTFLFQGFQKEGIGIGVISDDQTMTQKRKHDLPPIEKVLKGMEIFCDCAFALVCPSDYESNHRKKQAVFAYFFGACDALGQMHHITPDENIRCFSSFLESRFPSMTAAEREDLVSFIIDASEERGFAPFVQAGGQSIVEWSRGNSKAPLGLMNMLMRLDNSPES